MYELKKKFEGDLRLNLLGPGPRLLEKEFTGAAVSKFWGGKYSWMRRKTQTQMLAWGNYNMLQDFISPVIDN